MLRLPALTVSIVARLEIGSLEKAKRSARSGVLRSVGSRSISPRSSMSAASLALQS